MELRQPSAQHSGAATLELRRSRPGRYGNRVEAPTGFRNGVPVPVRYVWRARVYPWAARIIAAAMTDPPPGVPPLSDEERARRRGQNQRAWRRRQARGA